MTDQTQETREEGTPVACPIARRFIAQQELAVDGIPSNPFTSRNGSDVSYTVTARPLFQIYDDGERQYSPAAWRHQPGDDIDLDQWVQRGLIHTVTGERPQYRDYPQDWDPA